MDDQECRFPYVIAVLGGLILLLVLCHLIELALENIVQVLIVVNCTTQQQNRIDTQKTEDLPDLQ